MMKLTLTQEYQGITTSLVLTHSLGDPAHERMPPLIGSLIARNQREVMEEALSAAAVEVMPLLHRAALLSSINLKRRVSLEYDRVKIREEQLRAARESGTIE